MCSSMLSLKFFVYSKYHSAHSENRDQRTRQVVATRGYKQWKFITRQALKGGRDRLQEAVVTERFQL